MRMSENQLAILQDRYFRRDSNNNLIESDWSQVCRRIAKTIASAEVEWTDDVERIRAVEQEFYDAIYEMLFLPNSPVFFNAGARSLEPELLYKPAEQTSLEDYKRIREAQRNAIGTLSACFLVPITDTMQGIFKCIEEMALTTKWGGGVGINFSPLRPADSPVAGTGGVASGPIPFMHVINSAAEAIKQGSLRRAALMGILNLDHPDVEKFITCKRDNDGKSVLNYFNISVNIDEPEKFLELLDSDGQIELRFNGRVHKTIPAKELFYKLAENAHLRGDPGLIFVGRAKRYWPNPEVELIGSNPCGEVIMPAYFNCTLGSINYHKLYELYGAKMFELGSEENEALKRLVHLAIRFLDNVVSLNNFPLEEQKRVNERYRMIGLGMMGCADVLYEMKIRYGTKQGNEMLGVMASALAYFSKLASMKLAQERGPYPEFDKSRYTDPDFLPFATIPEEQIESELLRDYTTAIRQLSKLWSKTGLRNVRTNAIAPTGTISSLAEVSSGIEPQYALFYTRNMTTKTGETKKLTIIDRVLLKHASQEQIEAILRGKKATDFAELRHFVTALDISQTEHIYAQHYVQSYIDGSCSKTINMPANATIDDVLEAYKLAMRLNCYGITVYRDSSLQTQVLETKAQPIDVLGIQLFVDTNKKQIVPKPRRQFMKSYTGKFTNEVGTTYITITVDENNKPYEIFIEDGKSKSEIIGRLGSIALRSGVGIDQIIEQLSKCKSQYAREIANFLKDFLRETEVQYVSADKCPVCGGKLIKYDGCTKCESCGYATCG